MKVHTKLSTLALVLIFALTLIVPGVCWQTTAVAVTAPRIAVQNAYVYDDYVTLEAVVNNFSSNFHVTEYGFYHNPDYDELEHSKGEYDNRIRVGGGADLLSPGDSFTFDLDDVKYFDTDEPYYYMAYVKYEDLDFHNEGIDYGEIESFKLDDSGVPKVATVSAAGIESDSAILNGEIISFGDDNEIIEYGFYYGTSSAPSTKKKVGDAEDNIGALDSFKYELSNLMSGTTYYYKAYAHNSEGIAYGNVAYFTTEENSEKPIVNTKKPSAGTDQVTLYGVVTDEGGSNIESYGFYYGPNTSTSTRIEVGANVDEDETFSYRLTGLKPGTTYYAKAYAKNDEGTSYGSLYSFTAGSSLTPSIFTIGSYYYLLNGSYQMMDAAPYIKDSRTYMPILYVGYAMGLTDSQIQWNEAAQTVTLTKGSKTVILIIDNRTMFINGSPIIMDVAPEITNNRTCLPIVWIATAFGYMTEWDPITQTVTIR